MMLLCWLTSGLETLRERGGDVVAKALVLPGQVALAAVIVQTGLAHRHYALFCGKTA